MSLIVGQPSSFFGMAETRYQYFINLTIVKPGYREDFGSFDIVLDEYGHYFRRIGHQKCA